MIVFLHNHYQSWREKTCLSKMSYICLSFLLFQLKKSSVFKTENGQNQSTLLAFPSSFFIWLVYVAFQRTQKAFIWGRHLSDLHPTPPPPFMYSRTSMYGPKNKKKLRRPPSLLSLSMAPPPHSHCRINSRNSFAPIRVAVATLFLPIFSSFGFRPNQWFFVIEYSTVQYSTVQCIPTAVNQGISPIRKFRKFMYSKEKDRNYAGVSLERLHIYKGREKRMWNFFLS
jgi:hypothetical protein